MSKIQPIHGHKVDKHDPEGENVRRTLHTKRKKLKWYKILGKSDIFRETEGKKEETRVAVGTHVYRRTKDRGFSESIIKTKTKQNKSRRNTRERRHNIRPHGTTYFREKVNHFALHAGRIELLNGAPFSYRNRTPHLYENFLLRFVIWLLRAYNKYEVYVTMIDN